MSNLPKDIEKILKKMYKIPFNEDIKSGDIPLQVELALSDASKLCQRAGGELVSRQIIANIVMENDVDRCWDK